MAQQNHGLLPCVLAVVILCGCGTSGLGVGVKVGVNEDTLKALQDSIRALADAIPGGRYTRLIEDLHGGDPAKRAAAQEFLKSLAGLDPKIDYNVSVWFEYDQHKPLHAVVFRATLPTKDEIETRYKQAWLTNAPSVSSTPLGGPSIDLIGKELRKALSVAIPSTAAYGRTISVPTYMPGVQSTSTLPSTAVEDFAKVFEVFYRDWPLPLPASVNTMPWPLFDDRQVLFILIPESDWVAHDDGKDIRVTALIHKSGDPKTPLSGISPITFTRDEWSSIQLRDSHRPPRDYRWAVHMMTDTLMMSAATAEKVTAVQRALARWEEVTKEPTKKQ